MGQYYIKWKMSIKRLKIIKTRNIWKYLETYYSASITLERSPKAMPWEKHNRLATIFWVCTCDIEYLTPNLCKTSHEIDQRPNCNRWKYKNPLEETCG